MARKPFTHRFSSFAGGQNTVKDPLALASGNPQAPEEGFRVLGAEFRSGILRGMYGPGTAVAGPAIVNATRFIYYISGTGWVTQAMNSDGLRQNWACRDTMSAGNTTYATSISAAGAVSLPRVHYGGADYQLGIIPPSVAATTTVVGAVDVQYCYTYYCSATSLESNPSPRSVTKSNGGIVSVTASADTRVDFVRVYRTAIADPTGIMYYLGQMAAAATLNTAALSLTLTTPLDWGLGGYLDDPLNLTFTDHSPAPLLTCIASAMHGDGGVGTGEEGNRSGTLFGAVDAWIYYSRTGYPQHWPSRNVYRLPEPSLAIVSTGTTTTVLCESSIWQITGPNSVSMSLAKTRATVGPLLNGGKTAVPTPWGILYLSREGVMIFDGQTSQNLTRDILPASAIIGLGVSTYWSAAFYEDYYIFSNAVDATYALDMRNYPRSVSLVKLDRIVKAFHIVPNGSLGTTQSLYVAITAGVSTIQPWRPEGKTAVTGAARETTQHKTGALSFGDPTRLTDLTKYRLDGTGTVTMSVFVNPTDLTSDAAPAFSIALALPMTEARWFPRTCQGRTFSFLFDVPATASLNPGSHLEGVTNV